MYPKVILHMGVSADGRYDWGISTDTPYYEIMSHFHADADLSGSNTIQTASFPDDPGQAFPGMDGKARSERPLLAVVDSQGKIRNWHLIQKQPWWGKYVALCSAATPPEHIQYLQAQQVEIIRTGKEHVDLRLALAELHERFGVRVVRVDSGGILNGVLLRAGLVDEINLVIHPELVGGTSPKSMFIAPDLTSGAAVIPLKLLRAETIRGKYVWLQYAVIRE